MTDDQPPETDAAVTEEPTEEPEAPQPEDQDAAPEPAEEAEADQPENADEDSDTDETTPPAEGEDDTAEDQAPEETTQANTIIDIVRENGRFETLMVALTEADLIDTLQGQGPFTVFAPTDEAFEQLPEGTLDELLKDIPTLTEVLEYHVAAERLLAADVAQQESIDTLQGTSLAVTVEGDVVMVGKATLSITDIEGDNGVIHVIDRVLLPPDIGK